MCSSNVANNVVTEGGGERGWVELLIVRGPRHLIIVRTTITATNDYYYSYIFITSKLLLIIVLLSLCLSLLSPGPRHLPSVGTWLLRPLAFHPAPMEAKAAPKAVSISTIKATTIIVYTIIIIIIIIITTITQLY